METLSKAENSLLLLKVYKKATLSALILTFSEHLTHFNIYFIFILVFIQ